MVMLWVWWEEICVIVWWVSSCWWVVCWVDGGDCCRKFLWGIGRVMSLWWWGVVWVLEWCCLVWVWWWDGDGGCICGWIICWILNERLGLCWGGWRGRRRCCFRRCRWWCGFCWFVILGLWWRCLCSFLIRMVCSWCRSWLGWGWSERMDVSMDGRATRARRRLVSLKNFLLKYWGFFCFISDWVLCLWCWWDLWCRMWWWWFFVGDCKSLFCVYLRRRRVFSSCCSVRCRVVRVCCIFLLFCCNYWWCLWFGWVCCMCVWCVWCCIIFLFWLWFLSIFESCFRSRDRVLSR